MICKLCQNDARLVKSHIIPKFVARWLKDTSATGYLRQAVNPNVRRQDFPTYELLCDECESRLSVWEKQFYERIFLPYQEGQNKFAYTDWLLFFVVSLSWRVGVVTIENFRSYKPHLVHYLEEALSVWRSFLLAELSTPGQYTHHLLFLDFVAQAEGIDLPDGFHWYILRSIDATIPANDKNVFVYVKLPGMVFFSGVHPKTPVGWKNTQVFQSGEISASLQEITDPLFGDFFLDRAQQAMRLGISGRQERKIVEKMIQNPMRSLQSHSFQVYLAEEYWKKRRQSKR